jgi:6-pyruvoyltetrahydropterin/6-carboxytetrahydropterin synthase
MVYLTKRLMFSSAHRLFNPEFSDKKNKEIFDKCNNFYGHGHNYDLEVTVKGIPDPETGYVIDLKELKDIMTEEVIEKVDHKHLNYDVDFLQGIIPTVENLCVIFWKILKDKLPSGQLHKIKIHETDDSYCEYYGGDIEIKRFNKNL